MSKGGEYALIVKAFPLFCGLDSMNTSTKLITWSCLAVFLMTTAPAFSQQQANDQRPASNAPIAIRIESARPSASNVLTEDQIAALLTDSTDEKSKAQLQFSASFGLRTVTPKENKKFIKSGKIPIYINCQLVEIKEINGKKLTKRMGGTAHFYIQDSDGNVIVNKALSLDKMCPS
ncbi:MAG: hypothetical protein KKG09_09340 [Verrucomicrobia bacterium]|nr:hypothetical protein [Verrucomicrobiota bacterium]MBU4292116.1 hypothetical protein [Verrucomicrobiota bacterium]MBU4498193.1 hypothetical protein [Verrucomicrobiota bacterium]MCG2681393.1 hypothetical protein [Kiritimatiellia bacterium]